MTFRSGTYDLVQHETLPVNLDADPFDVAVNFWLGNVDREHISLHGRGIMREEQGVVVEVAV